MKRGTILTIILVAFCLMATISNPNEQQHKNAVKKIFNQQMTKGVIQGLNSSGLEGLDGLMKTMTGAVGGALVENCVSVKNHVVFSITVLEFDGKTREVGFGFLGNVHIYKSVKEKLKKSLY